MLISPVADAPAEEWTAMLDVNVAGLLFVSQAAIPHLVEAAAGPPRHVADLVNISSTGGRVARPGTAVCNLTKFGVTGFTEALRQELQPQRVRGGVIEPGIVDTELSSHVRPELRADVQARLRPDAGQPRRRTARAAARAGAT